MSQDMDRAVVQKKKNYNKGEARTTDKNKEKDPAFSNKAATKGKQTLPKDWNDALPGHIMTFIEIQELSTGLGPRQCCGEKGYSMAKNEMTPGPYHFVVGCGGNICISCIEGRLDGGKF